MENRYKIFKENDKFSIYSVYGKFIVSCTNRKTAEYLLSKLIKDDLLLNKIYLQKVR